MPELDRNLYIAQVQAEMNAAIASGHSVEYFKNFSLLFHETSRVRNFIEINGLMDTQYHNFISNPEPLSDLFLHQTPREFYLTIEQVVSELGRDKEDVKLLLTSESYYFYHNWAPKIFMKLIALGYNWEDLLI